MRRILFAISLTVIIATFAWGDGRTITINRNSCAAIAYSPSTGKYGLAYDLRSRADAE